MGTRSDHPDEFTADDLVSVALLSTPIRKASADTLLRVFDVLAWMQSKG